MKTINKSNFFIKDVIEKPDIKKAPSKAGISVQGGTKSKKNLIDIFAKSEIFENTRPYTIFNS